MESSEDEFLLNKKDISAIRKNAINIEKLFDVQLIVPTTNEASIDEMLWISLKGKIGFVQSAKNYVKALTTPDHTEFVWLPDVPPCVFIALKGFWLRRIEFLCSAVLESTSEEKSLNVKGAELDVVRAISILQHLQNIATKEEMDIRIDCDFYEIIIQCSDPYEDDLIALNTSLKKELLKMIHEAGLSFDVRCIREENMQDQTNPKELLSPTLPSKKPNLTSTPSRLDTFSGASKLLGQMQGVPSQSKSQLEKFEETTSSKSTTSSSISSPQHQTPKSPQFSPPSNLSRSVVYVSSDDELDSSNEMSPFAEDILPPQVAIEGWLEVQYTATTTVKDFVYKEDLLEHFREHFCLVNYPDLAKDFFITLAQHILKNDVKYKNVKVEGTLGRMDHRQRVLCLRRNATPLEFARTLSPVVAPPSATTSSSSGIINSWCNNSSGSASSQHAYERDKHKPQANIERANKSPMSVGTWQMQETQYGRSASLLHPPVAASSSLEDVNRIAKALDSSSSPEKPNARDVNLVFANTQQQQRKTQDAGNHPKSNNHQQSASSSYHANNTMNMSTLRLLDLPNTPGKLNLRPIVIDGSNVACNHGNSKKFDCRGIALCVHYFWLRGHRNITCFVPNYRKGNKGYPPKDDPGDLVVNELERRAIMKFTPSRIINGKPITSYDDRFVVQLACTNGGVIVSNDQFRDLAPEKLEWKHVIETRLLTFVFVGDIFMPPEDPLGSRGPTLDDFLTMPPNSGGGGEEYLYHHQPPPAHLLPAPNFPGSSSSSSNRVNSPRYSPAKNTKNFPPLPAERSQQQNQRVEMERNLHAIFPNNLREVRLTLDRYPNEFDLNFVTDKLIEIIPNF